MAGKNLYNYADSRGGTDTGRVGQGGTRVVEEFGCDLQGLFVLLPFLPCLEFTNDRHRHRR